MHSNQKNNRGISTLGGIALVLILIIGAAAGAIVVLGQRNTIGLLSKHIKFLERDDPEIDIIEASDGLGANPASFRFGVTDSGMGLDEVVVRVIQKKVAREIARASFKGEHSIELPITLRQEKGGLDEGQAELEIKAFDKSFWSNAAEERLPIKIDYKKPRIEVVSAQHNAVEGGSQLLFYKAFDEHLARSGVKVGSKVFFGVPARGLDPELTDPNLFAVFYAVPTESGARGSKVIAFAEDVVGNSAATSNFYYKNSTRSYRQASNKLSEEFLRRSTSKIFKEAESQLKTDPGLAEKIARIDSEPDSIEKLIEEFKIVNTNLRSKNEEEIAALLKTSKPQKLWVDTFLSQPGSITGAFGDKLSYTFGDQKFSGPSRTGYEYLMQGGKGAAAANTGIVAFVQKLGVYGLTVGIDHGLGITTTYSLLGDSLVRPGDRVEKGREIAQALGASGRIIFEMRVGGVPVDAREWWDAPWTKAHIIDKINEVKKALGLSISPANQP